MSKKEELSLDELEKVTGGSKYEHAPYWGRKEEVQFAHNINDQVELDTSDFIFETSTRCIILNRGVGVDIKGTLGYQAYVPIYWLQTLNRDKSYYDGWYVEGYFRKHMTTIPVSQELY